MNNELYNVGLNFSKGYFSGNIYYNIMNNSNSFTGNVSYYNINFIEFGYGNRNWMDYIQHANSAYDVLYIKFKKETN